jgi:L-fucose isomerase-like protein
VIVARLGILPLARPNFDVAYAEETAEKAFATLDASGHQIVGARDLLFDADTTEEALKHLKGMALDLVLLLQVTFTDASMTAKIAANLHAPIAIWAFPEPRTGGRLRLNSFCGLNLAGHALGLAHRDFGFLYSAPDAPGTDVALEEILQGGRRGNNVQPVSPAVATGDGASIVDRIRGARIGRLGEHPVGFDTCDYNEDRLRALADITVEPVELTRVFNMARAAPQDALDAAREIARSDVTGLEDVNAEELDHSLRLKSALDRLREEGRYSAFAVRCWPETFTEYGGAVCGPVAMMGERRVPCACEADVYGALTSLILQEAAGEPAFLVDVVDIDTQDGTSVVWHCGQAPISMHDPEIRPHATIHSNRRMPLLYEFPLKPGRVTLARVSQARGDQKLVIAGAEMVRAPLPFSGTAGTLRTDAPAREMLDTIIGSALEHHMALVYGDVRGSLRAVAANLGLPVLAIA